MTMRVEESTGYDEISCTNDNGDIYEGEYYSNLPTPFH